MRPFSGGLGVSPIFNAMLTRQLSRSWAKLAIEMQHGPIEIPRDLVDNQLRYHGEAGRRWLDQLPTLAQSIAGRWDLSLEPAFPNGFSDYVAPVRKADHSPAVLKLCFIDAEFFSQEAALRAYDGRAAVRLLKADLDSGALLLERLEPGESLSVLHDDAAEMHVAAAVMQQLWQAKPGDAGLLRLDPWLDEANLPDALPLHKRSMPWVSKALARAAELIAELTDYRVLHGDLHHYNILSSQRGWLAIDPKGILGDPAWELAPLLFNNLDAAGRDWPRVMRRRIDQLCDEIPLDRERAYALSAARCLQSRFWSLRDDSIPSHDFIARCLDCAEELSKGP